MSRLDSLLAVAAGRDPLRMFLRGTAEYTYEQADQEVSRRSLLYRQQGEGKPVAVRDVNGPEWVLNVLSLMRADLPAMLLPRELSDSEGEAMMEAARTPFQVEGDRWTRTGIAVDLAPVWSRLDVAVGFATSGSTGQAKLVLRSHGSLIDEGQRYQSLWRATADDVFFALAPLYHAYSFGAALASALVAGGTLVPVVFRSPHLVSSQVRACGATIMLLVPAMARALAIADQGKPVQSSLRIAMTGAGHTNEALSASFAMRWGMGLSRNYGSSETGGLLAALSPQDDGATGRPMSGIQCELVPSTDGGGDQLWVQLPHPPCGYCVATGYEPAHLAPGGWWPMGDMFERRPSGDLLLIGRKGSAIRRGGHTIQPREVEAALLTSPAITEVFVKGSLDRHGEQMIEAHVSLKEQGSVSVEDLRNWLTTKVAAYKIPNKWNFYTQLPKTWSYKVNQQLLSSAPDPTPRSLWDAMQSFRLPHALVAAQQVGLFQALEQDAQPVSLLAERTSCNPQALAMLLDFLEYYGIVKRSTAGHSLTSTVSPAWASISTFEDHLRRTWLSPERIVAALRTGPNNRAFEKEPPSPAFYKAYTQTFCGPWQDLVALTLRRTLRLNGASKTIEIGRAAGRITSYLRQTMGMNCTFHSLGPAPGSTWHALSETERTEVVSWSDLVVEPSRFNVVVLTNVIHWLSPLEAEAVLKKIGDALLPGGTVVIVDIFVDTAPESTLFLLDWLTHGGVYWSCFSDLKTTLLQADLSVVETTAVRGTPAHCILCRRPTPYVL